MCLNPKPNVALLCVSTDDQIIQSNVVPPICVQMLVEVYYILVPSYYSFSDTVSLIQIGPLWCSVLDQTPIF